MKYSKTSNKVIERYLYAKNNLNSQTTNNFSSSKADKQIQSKNDENPNSFVRG